MFEKTWFLRQWTKARVKELFKMKLTEWDEFLLEIGSV